MEVFIFSSKFGLNVDGVFERKLILLL